MASALIASRRTISGNQPAIRRLPEEAAQTFLDGTPVMLNPVDGGVQAWDGVTVAAGIAGFAKEPASGLTTTGVRKFLTGPPPPNQPLGQTIFRGVPYNDGRVGFEVAGSDTVFAGQVGPLQVPTAANIGKQYGLTKDTDGHWYVDLTKVGAAAVVTIVNLGGGSPIGAQGAVVAFDPRAVAFQVNLAAQQISPA
jgi:hypothetical protein